MSDSGSTQFPAGPRIAGQLAKPAPQTEPNARIVGVPNDLRTLEKSVRIVGEVVQDNGDGSVRVRTSSGDVDIRPDDRSARFQRGDKVELQIQPGTPPTEVRVERQISEPSAPRPSTPPPPRGSETPVSVDVRPIIVPPRTPDTPQQPNTDTTSNTPRPTPDTAPPPVRLQAILPQQLAQYVQEPVQIISALLKATAEASVQIIQAQVQNLSADIPQQTPRPLPTEISLPAATPAGPVSPQNLDQQILNASISLFDQDGEATLIITPPSSPLTNQTAIPVPVSDTLLQTAPQTVTQKVFNLFRTNNTQNTLLTTPAVTTSSPTPAAPAPVFERIFHAALFSQDDVPVDILQPQNSNITGSDFMKQPLILKNQRAGEITGLVIGQTPQQFPVLGFSLPGFEDPLFFIAQTPMTAFLQPGAHVTLVPTSPQAASLYFPAATGAQPLPGLFLTPEPWPLMQDIYQTLAQTLPKAAMAMANMTPSPSNPGQLGPVALFFLAAVKNGDLTQWLGDRATDMIRRSGRSGLITRLGQETSALNRLSSEQLSQDWRGMSLPLYWDGDMHKIALYYKSDKQSADEDDSKGKQTRFIFDLNLDHMGPVQLDGLFKAPRLDLIVRTQYPFSRAMQLEIQTLYNTALEETRIHGDLSFQNKPEQWVKINVENEKFGVSA